MEAQLLANRFSGVTNPVQSHATKSGHYWVGDSSYGSSSAVVAALSSLTREAVENGCFIVVTNRVVIISLYELPRGQETRIAFRRPWIVSIGNS